MLKGTVADRCHSPRWARWNLRPPTRMQAHLDDGLWGGFLFRPGCREWVPPVRCGAAKVTFRQRRGPMHFSPAPPRYRGLSGFLRFRHPFGVPFPAVWPDVSSSRSRTCPACTASHHVPVLVLFKTPYRPAFLVPFNRPSYRVGRPESEISVLARGPIDQGQVASRNRVSARANKHRSVGPRQRTRMATRAELCALTTPQHGPCSQVPAPMEVWAAEFPRPVYCSRCTNMESSERIVQSDVFHIGINTIMSTATASCNRWEHKMALGLCPTTNEARMAYEPVRSSTSIRTG